MGQTVSGRPGDICYDDDCSVAAFEVSTLGRTGDERRAAELGLSPSTKVFVVSWGNREALLLIERPDKSLLAEFNVCGTDDHVCAAAFQVWTPTDRTARIVNLLKQ